MGFVMAKKLTKKATKILKNMAQSVKNTQAPQVITVKNADGETDTTATILIQNKINYIPKVSVIIPVYNVEQWLPECLDSICNQTLKEIEIICIDDESTDKSLDVLKEYAQKDNRITVIAQKNSGAGIARNCGLNVMCGKFVAFMDPDDFYPSKDTLKHLYDTAINNNVKICGGTMQIFMKDKTDLMADYLFEVYGKKTYQEYQFDCGYTRFIYDTDLIKKNNIFFPHYLRGQDPVFFVQVMHEAGEFYVMEEPSYTYRFSHKVIKWTENKFNDYVCSLTDNLKFAIKHEYSKLIDTIIDRRIDKLRFFDVDDTIRQSKYMQNLLKLRESVRDTDYKKFEKNNKKIFLISHPQVISSVGGATSVFWNMAKYLNDNGYDVTCLCYSNFEANSPQITDVHFVNLKKFYRTMNFSDAINTYIDYKKPDLMVFFFPDVFLNANLTEQNQKIPKILMFHSRPDWYFHGWDNAKMDDFKKSYVNTYTHVLLQNYANLLPPFVDKDKVFAIANPVQQIVKRDNFKEHKKLIYLTRLDEAKGVEFLLLAYKIVVKKFSDWHLDIYGQFGTKEYEEQVRKTIKALKLSRNVHLKGVTTDVLKTFCEYDFCVFPSNFEGFSVGLSEALSVGLPCIGLCGASGVNEQIIDGFNGFLCDNKYTDFADKIKTLIIDKTLREKFSKNATESVKQYADDVIYNKWLVYINNILSGKKIQYSETKNNSVDNTLFPVPAIKRAYLYNQEAVDIYKKTHVIPSGPKEVIVSLTSFPARINVVHQTIESLLNQSFCPDKVVLWLAPEQFPNKEADLPQNLLNLKYKGLVIDWYHDIKSYKKLIPALQKYPDAVIVTADDDIIYNKDWLNKLVSAYKQDDSIIWAHRAHRIDEKHLCEYDKWAFCIDEKSGASFKNFCTTGGGVLYPPHCFYKDVCKEKLFIKLCPTGDDIWFWAMLVLNKNKIKLVNNPDRIINCIDGTQEDALWKINLTNNDIQLCNIFKRYPKIVKLLCKNKYKPYLLLPYYGLAIFWMKVFYIPAIKFSKHIKSVVYSHTNRGKTDLLNKNFRQIIDAVRAVKNETNNQIELLKNQINNQQKLFESKILETNKKIDAIQCNISEKISESINFQYDKINDLKDDLNNINSDQIELLKNQINNQQKLFESKILETNKKIDAIQCNISEKISESVNFQYDKINDLKDGLNNINSELNVKYDKLSANISKGIIQQNTLMNTGKNLEQMLIKLYTLKSGGVSNTLEFRTFGDLAHCIRHNLYKIPNDIDLVVGIPRSGIIPAYVIALFMNKKCCSLDEFVGGINSSNGFRNVSDKPIHNVLVVDDSVFSGKEMARVREKLSNFKDYNFTYMAVYAITQSVNLVDVYLEIVDGRRVWQWNYLNHNFATSACFDMDGVLCVDPTDEQNDDGEKYKQFILNAKPLYIPNYKIRAIVTSRLEKYRELTEQWLAKNNVQYTELIMLDLPTAAERQKQACHAKFKADVYSCLTDTNIFIESNPNQAKEIAARTGKQVLCVENDELY